jgi:hypothetical protein
MDKHRIYLTHCSKEKNLNAKTTGEAMPPDKLYTEPGIQQFMERCKSTNVDWAILSDNYGVFLPLESHIYYEKAPSTVTTEEECLILENFDRGLEKYGEIWFYIRPDTFHPFYDRILTNSLLHARIHSFTDLSEIE